MTFPAWYDLYADTVIARHPTALRVYAQLLRNESIFFEPQVIKAQVLADAVGTNRRRVQEALEMLVSRGYVIEHRRGHYQTRRLTLARVRINCTETEHP